MEHTILRTILFIAIIVTANATAPHPCLQYRNARCRRCRENFTIQQGKCKPNIQGCQQYANGQSVLCVDGSQPKQQICKAVTGKSALPGDQKGNDVTLFHLAFGSNDPEYQQIPLETCRQDVLFTRCDSLVRSSKYNPMISKGQSPWTSVAAQSLPFETTYRIVYDSPGGGALLCLVQINKITKAVSLKQGISIQNWQLIPYCLDYESAGQCSVCKEGYHLDDNVCYRDIAGCVSYYHELCLECEGWSLLIENRCLADCPSQCDLIHSPYFGNILLQPKNPQDKC